MRHSECWNVDCDAGMASSQYRVPTSFIKDATTIVSRAACYLEAERRIALTGTPIQNKLDDVWALIKFLRFAPFDDKTVWTTYILGLAKAGNSLGVARLQTILKHCTLRRTKESTNANGE